MSTLAPLIETRRTLSLFALSHHCRHRHFPKMLRVLRRVILVPGRHSWHISCREYVIVHDIERESAVNCDLIAFVFVARDIGWQMRNDVPQIHDAITDVHVGVKKTYEIAVPNARFRPGVNLG